MSRGINGVEEADARIRTADPFITSEVLYQLSYVGPARDSLARPRRAYLIVTRQRIECAPALLFTVSVTT